MTRAIVYYYSRTGNTKRIAEQVAQTLGADLEELQDPADYRGVLGFLKGGRDAMRGAAHEIRPLTHPPSGYDFVVIGQPVWAARPVPAVKGFIRQHELTGKAVALFVTFDGAGDDRCLQATAAMLGQSRIVGQTSFRKVGRNPERNIERARAWAAEISGSRHYQEKARGT